jgi:Fe-S-cluster-containing hydrogenase component 2
MVRKIIKINEEKCNGCGLCTSACHEGALKIVDGKAKLISDVYCDGLGNCLPGCPTGAIEIIEREAEDFDEEAVRKHLSENGLPPLDSERSEESPAKSFHQKTPDAGPHPFSGCPGSRARVISRQSSTDTASAEACAGSNSTAGVRAQSQLGQWPCQIRLVPPGAPYFDNADLLVAADCTAFAYANIHQDFMKNKITIIGCPKLDDVDYSEKLAQILSGNNIKSITVLRMEVPCCGGLVHAVKNAMLKSGVLIPWKVVTISTDGEILA